MKVKYTVDKVLPGETLPEGVGVGFITKDMMAEKLPKPTDDCMMILCGVCLFFFCFFLKSSCVLF